jgi:hypothetical protein
MKTKITRYATKAMLFVTVLLATCFFAGRASAQAGFRGKFTLPFETHWGKAVLPAGEYLLFSLDGDNKIPDLWAIRDAKSLRAVAYEPVGIRDDRPAGKSALLVSRRGTQHVVYALRIAELGQVFVYDPTLAHAAAVQEARQAETVPVVLAQK